MTACGPAAAIASASRPSSAASSAPRVSKRRVVRVVMILPPCSFCPSTAARTLPHLRPYLEDPAATHATQQHARAGLTAGDAPEGILRAVGWAPIDAEQQIARLQPRMLRGATDVEIADQHRRLPESELLCLLLRHI